MASISRKYNRDKLGRFSKGGKVDGSKSKASKQTKKSVSLEGLKKLAEGGGDFKSVKKSS